MITPKQQARARILHSVAKLQQQESRTDALIKQAKSFRNTLLVKRAKDNAVQKIWNDLGEDKWVGPNGRYIAVGATGGLTLGMLYGAMKALVSRDKDAQGLGYNLTHYGLRGLVAGTGIGAVTAGSAMLMTDPDKTKAYVDELPAIKADEAPELTEEKSE